MPECRSRQATLPREPSVSAAFSPGPPGLSEPSSYPCPLPQYLSPGPLRSQAILWTPAPAASHLPLLRHPPPSLSLAFLSQRDLFQKCHLKVGKYPVPSPQLLGYTALSCFNSTSKSLFIGWRELGCDPWDGGRGLRLSGSRLVPPVCDVQKALHKLEAMKATVVGARKVASWAELGHNSPCSVCRSLQGDAAPPQGEAPPPRALPLSFPWSWV